MSNAVAWHSFAIHAAWIMLVVEWPFGIGLWSQTAVKHNLLSKLSFLVYPSLEKLQLSYMNNGDLPSFLCVHGVNV